MDDLCPACSMSDAVSFFSVDGVPTSSCVLLDDEQEARSCPRGRIELAVCRACGFITNRAFEPSLTEYSSRYEETQAFSPTFVEFAKALAKQWVDRYNLHGARILEIGCGKGEFLVWMLEAGAGSATGIDPGVRPERLDTELAGRIEWIADLYDDRWLDLEADAIVCRHTLEHIHAVGDFLRLIRSHTDARDIPLLFEVPDARRVLDEGAFWDVYYEHCSYFTAGSLARLFRRCGFEVLDVALAYDDQYLLLEARPTGVSATPAPLPIEEQADSVLEIATRFATRHDEMITRLSTRFYDVRARGGRTVLWGGSSKAVGLLSVPSVLDGLTAVVDVNPHKQGRYLAGTGHQIVAPEALPLLRPDLIVVANPVYLAEIRRQVREMDIECEVTAL
jgi:SAM-dependent methyltransferase